MMKLLVLLVIAGIIIPSDAHYRSSRKYQPKKKSYFISCPILRFVVDKICPQVTTTTEPTTTEPTTTEPMTTEPMTTDAPPCDPVSNCLSQVQCSGLGLTFRPGTCPQADSVCCNFTG